MSRWSPMGAFCGGLAAGFVGALAQNLFFAATKRLAPAPSAPGFEPAEPEQAFEMPTQTLARRVTEQLVRRGPLEHKALAGQIVHLAFGSAWGGAYGLAVGTLPRAGSLRGGLQFGLLVWLVSDDILLPAFRLSAWPHHYPVKTHLYALAAHAVYGAAVAGAFAAIHSASTPALAALGSRWVTRRVPRLLRPTARRVVARGIRVALPIRDAALAFG
jgi:uncharacterized membrane protein YagU involved in acid resistance